MSRNSVILVTGGAGFIGSEFVRQIVNSESFSKVIVYDKLTYAGDLDRIKEELLSENVLFIHDDIVNINDHLSELLSVDQVVHFAAESHVDNSINSGNIFVESNILGTYILLEFFRRINANIKILIASTDEVYGSLKTDFADESFPLSPSSPYSASKASADLLALANFKTHNQNIVITRTCNNYGPFQDVEKFIPKTITNLIEGLPAIIYGNGENVREWIHVTDNCEAINLVLQHGSPGEIYNIGTNYRLTNIEIVDLIIKELKLENDMKKFVTDRLGHDFRYALNSSKVHIELSWSQKINFEKGLSQTINWHLNKSKQNKK
jgi:dTDP-glucose 4,6-dehydratase